MDQNAFDTPLDYKDRRTFLIISGIILALIGCLLGLVSGLYIFLFGFGGIERFMPVSSGPGSAGGAEVAVIFEGRMKQFVLAGGILYGIIAAGFLVVGIGNLFLRRWSRPLALILSACWAYSGVAAVIWTMISFSHVREAMYEQVSTEPGGPGPAMPGAGVFVEVMMIFNLTLYFIFGVMLPAFVFWMNFSRDARIAVETSDRKPRWTDRCPVPVLGIAVVAAAGGITILAAAFWLPVLPAFGQILTGRQAQILMLIAAAALIFIAWGAYRKQLTAWALALIFVTVSSASAVMTFLRLGWRELYERMGIPIPDSQLDQTEKMMDAIYSGNTLSFSAIVGILPVVAYLIWSVRFFKKTEQPGVSV